VLFISSQFNPEYGGSIFMRGMDQTVGYADDICFLGRSLRWVKDMYQDLRINGGEVGLKININKTKAVFQTGIQNRVDQQLVIGDNSIEVVDSFVYLGSCITVDNNEYMEIQGRLMLANKAYFSLVAVMRRADIHIKTKIMMYKTLIRSVLMYGCETWLLPQKSENCPENV
jgi:hypothetical protein